MASAMDQAEGKQKNACLKNIFQTGITVFTAWLPCLMLLADESVIQLRYAG